MILSNEIHGLASQRKLLVELVGASDRKKAGLYLDELVLRFYALPGRKAHEIIFGEHLDRNTLRAASERHELYQGMKELFLETS